MELPFLTFIGSLLGISGGIYGIFTKAGDNVNQETKKQVADWLQNLKIKKPLSNWPITFAILFDRVFTDKHFSLKCFFRSSIASCIAVISLSLLFVSFRPDFFRDLLLAKIGNDYEIITFIGLGALTLNVFPDYLSLLETRYIVKKMGETNSGIRWIFWLVLDLLLSATISLFFLVI